jgi:hypothetical protein
VAFGLNHRALPRGADVKLLWELSRWSALVRLAQTAYIIADARAGGKCLDWLENWARSNPPYRGWNWKSALETGIRLIQFTWMDAMLWTAAEAAGGTDWQERLVRLREAILPAHVWHAWRHRSFGSSANNHLLGELAGLILATVRWPDLERCGAPLSELQARWEREVLAQFASDGGNREQALHYQLFSFELCWQTHLALEAAGREVAADVSQRLERAARFYSEVQYRRDPWDYGDSDNAFVTPFFLREETAAAEWQEWMGDRNPAEGIHFWLGATPVRGRKPGRGDPVATREASDWWIYEESGTAIRESGFWFLRFDLSPQGYLATAAHGHLDALNLSLWFHGTAFVIDPGTGAYYADTALRSWLASRTAHNGPCPVGPEFPVRRGPFLWGGKHAKPRWKSSVDGLEGELALPRFRLRRMVRLSQEPSGEAWVVEDECRATAGGGRAFQVRWQFAPGTVVKRLEERRYRVCRGDASMDVEVAAAWNGVTCVETEAERAELEPDRPRAGVVSPSFRRTTFAPYLLLSSGARPEPCVFRTTFLASPRS